MNETRRKDTMGYYIDIPKEYKDKLAFISYTLGISRKQIVADAVKTHLDLLFGEADYSLIKEQQRLMREADYVPVDLHEENASLVEQE